MNLPKVYEPSEYENDIYALWEKAETFIPKSRGSTKTYSIVVPPPNANGDLHIGHALTLALEDIPVRYHRMKGEAALLLPGADHAGFETQVVYEKQLAKEGKSRFDYSRDELYKNIWEFVAKNRGNSEDQIRRLGASVDWTRHTFTLDDKIVRQAYATFKKMWDERLIYRGERLVNYCTFHGTAFADIEVSFKEVQGNLWNLRYPLIDGSGDIIVATTRPETMLGDVAVAVNPGDERYTHFIGKTVKLPLTNREIPIIADDFVDMSFGTGAVKITPAHDPNDFEASERHDLPKISVISHEGIMTHEVPEQYRGLPVDEARKLVVEDLNSKGYLVDKQPHRHNVGHCYKCGTVIQPLLREQWFINMQPLAQTAIKALRAGHITFYPDSKKQQLITYLKGLRDWNISRQIAWGIPIPAFQNVDDSDDWIYDERIEEEVIKVGGKVYRRDPDVFDTWFSSSSWPYATLGYPDSEDYDTFYPLNLMETGGEILYPWVSRMIMLGLYVTGEVPFKAVYVHGYVLAEDGAKMSKSIGNVINPISVIDTYGSDAMRMGIIAGRSAAVNRGYDQRRVEEARNFCNKLWNIARYIEDKIGDDFTDKREPAPESPADHWILSKLHHSVQDISEDLDNYRFAEAYERLYHLVWDDFADWYIEASKINLNKSVLSFGLETILKVAHPFAPFVTETIWQTLKWQNSSDALLIVAPWPEVPKADEAMSATFEEIKSIVSEVRFIKTAMKLGNDTTLLHASEPFLERQGDTIKSLARIGSIDTSTSGSGLKLVDTPYQCWLSVSADAAQAYRDELTAKLVVQENIISQLETRLANKGYVDHAPKNIVEQTKSQLEDAKTQAGKLLAEQQKFDSSK